MLKREGTCWWFILDIVDFWSTYWLCSNISCPSLLPPFFFGSVRSERGLHDAAAFRLKVYFSENITLSRGSGWLRTVGRGRPRESDAMKGPFHPDTVPKKPSSRSGPAGRLDRRGSGIRQPELVSLNLYNSPTYSPPLPLHRIRIIIDICI